MRSKASRPLGLICVTMAPNVSTWPVTARDGVGRIARAARQGHGHRALPGDPRRQADLTQPAHDERQRVFGVAGGAGRAQELNEAGNKGVEIDRR